MTPDSTPRPTRWFAVAVVVITVLFLAQGARLAQRMVSWGDESAYIHLGALEASGRISLFQDEMRGQRMPLPFYAVGLSQLVGPPSLLRARLISLAFGAIALICVGLLARGIGGDLAGVLAMLFLAGQGVMVGFFAGATYHGVAAAIFLGGLALALCVPAAWGRVAGMAVLSLLFLTRGSLWPVLPAALVYLLVRARNRVERLALLVAAGAIPVAFFASDVRHLKPLAYVPVLNRLVAPLGYRSVFPLIGHESHAARAQALGVVRLLRTYEFWGLAIVLLVALIVILRHRREPTTTLATAPALVVAGALVYTFVVQLPVYGDRFRELTGLFPSFAALVPVLLGVGYAEVLVARSWARWERAAVGALVAVLVLAPSLVIRHPLLPSGPDAAAQPLADLERAAAHLRTVIPAGSRVFLYGYSLPLHLAGRTPYLRQIHDPNSLAAVEDRARIERNGLWGLAEIDAWLGRDADYAVISPTVLATFRRTRPAAIARLEERLAANFEHVARVDEYRWWTYDVYARKGGAGRTGG